MNINDLLELDETRIKLTGELDGKFGSESDDLIIIFGAITTPERFENFSNSLCHLGNDGVIRRYGNEIGTYEDIAVIEH